MTLSLRERRRQMLRDEILNATQALIAEKGYAAMSMDDLAARVGVSKPTLYSHFETKEDLVVAMASRMTERIIEAFDAGREERTPLQQLALLLHTIIQTQVDGGLITAQIWMPDVFRILKTRPGTLKHMQYVDEAVVNLAQAGIDQGEIDPELDVATVVRIFHAFVSAPHLARLSKSGDPNPDRIADMLARSFTRSVKA